MSVENRSIGVMRTVIALLLTWVASAPAMAQVQGVTIYFIPWDVMTRAAFTAADVRSLARIKTEILDSQLAERFVKSLKGKKVSVAPSDVGDIRLVIDLDSRSGPTKSFVANRFYLLDEASGSVYKIDQRFRARFELVR